MGEAASRRGRSADRVDFVKRLFAVTLSVGFAGQLLRMMPAHPEGHNLDVAKLLSDNWQPGLLLISSVFAVVASWEGYLRAVETYPLEDVWRFYIDIILVFLYLFLCLCNEYYAVWFWVHVAIFTLYVIWDIFRMQTPEYKQLEKRPFWSNSLTISVVWLAYFIALAKIHHTETGLDFLSAMGAALIGVVVYRLDKKRRFSLSLKLASTVPPIAIVFAISRLT